MQHPMTSRRERTLQRVWQAASSGVSREAAKADRLAASPISLEAQGLVAAKTQQAGRLLPSAALVLLFVTLMIFASPGGALASWPVPGDPEVTLGFEERYEAQGGRHATHRGVDCAASAGETVTSPVDGIVSFAGSVPAGDEEGCGTTLAVSVSMADGRTLTLMPFEETWVVEGEVVSEGSPVGMLAASGDRSGALPHLHVGLKRGDAYYDPLPLLGLGLAPAGGDAAEDAPVSMPVAGERLEAAPDAAPALPAEAALQAWAEEADGLGAAAGEAAPLPADASPVPAALPEPEAGIAAPAEPTISSGEAAYEAWRESRRGGDLEEPEGLLDGIWRWVAGLHGKVTALVSSLAPGLASVAPAVAALSLAALVSAGIFLAVSALRTSAARRVRCRMRANMERGFKTLRLKLGAAKALGSP